MLDSDGDGVPDATDKCPREPGPPERDGCPMGIVILSNELVIPKHASFAVQGTVLSPTARKILDEIAGVLVEHSDVTRVHVMGHADVTEASPEKLSLLRAKAVVEYLIRAGVDAGRLSAEGKGTTAPLDTDTTSEGRANNRTVDFRIEQVPASSIPRPPSAP